MVELTVIGGGLAGCEAAWQAARRGVRVRLYEMRPKRTTGAHTSDRLSELVCSNSLGSDAPDTAGGLLKQEIRRLGSLILAAAERTAVPAGSALAVDRTAFAELVTKHIETEPLIELVREEAVAIPDGPAVIATGPLTSEALAESIARLTGSEHLYFYDALAPIVEADSIDMKRAFRASRYARERDPSVAPGEGDYVNCPLTREEYEAFVDALLAAQTIPLHAFEQDIRTRGVKAGLDKFFEGCLPVEIIAARGRDALAYGPMRPVGLDNPRTGRRPHAVLQLRQDNLAGTLYNLVGFQTNLAQAEQKRVFGMIPGLEQAEFVRFGQMHRNTFINSPTLLAPSLEFRPRSGTARPGLFFAGQLTGVEGYVGNAATGLLAGLNAARFVRREPLLELPRTTMLGALCWYVTHAEPKAFQPMKANLGILPAHAEPPRAKKQRAALHAERSRADLEAYLAGVEPTSGATR